MIHVGERPSDRSWQPPGPAFLFCPGDRPERFAKASAAADAVILDLEDAVTPSGKLAARQLVVRALDVGTVDPRRTVVRINALETSWAEADLAALEGRPLAAVMVPKADANLDPEAFGSQAIIALCETAAGVLTLPRVASLPQVVAVAWGGQDLAADLGLLTTDSTGSQGIATQHARVMTRYATAAAGIHAIDTVHTNIHDDRGLEAEAREAARLGFTAKLVIHPRQAAVVRRAFQPGDEEVSWARRILQAVERHSDAGVLEVDGRMIDAPVIARARTVLARAQPRSH